MRDIIYNILVRYYARLYGYWLCDAMAEYIADKINSGEFTTRKDVQMYVWMNTSGGGVAEEVGWAVHEALPHLISAEGKETRWK